jgi:hypothetical protein
MNGLGADDSYDDVRIVPLQPSAGRTKVPA